MSCNSPYYPINPPDTPNEGRVKINNTFDCLVNSFTNLSGLTASTIYTNLTPVPTTIGGIAAGTTFVGDSVSQIFNMLLYPYQIPVFSSFYINGQSSPLEVGATLAGGSRTFNWSTTNNGNINSNTIIIEDITTSTILANNIANGGTSACTISAVTNNSQTSHSWEIFGTNSQSSQFTDTFTVNWEWKLYYGTNASTSLVTGQITGLTSSLLTTGFAGTYAFAGNGQYDSIAYPSSFGTATSFKDTSTNLGVAMKPLYVVSVTNIFGQATNYNVHQTQFTQASALNIAIS